MYQGDGNEEAETKDRQTAATNYRHCLPFFLLMGTAGGALLANLLPQGQQGQLSAFLQQALADGDEISFAAIFWKYLKYDVIIWLGDGCSWGFFFAGAAFLFRSVCVGFTSAMMMAAYGMGASFPRLRFCRRIFC